MRGRRERGMSIYKLEYRSELGGNMRMMDREWSARPRDIYICTHIHTPKGGELSGDAVWNAGQDRRHLTIKRNIERQRES